jgi:hypothetical protein
MHLTNIKLFLGGLRMYPMRGLGFAVAFAVLSAAAVPSARAQFVYANTVTAQPGIMAYYQFAGTTNSSVGSYTGTLTTGASIDVIGSGPALTGDPNNQALNLNGTNGNELQSSLSNGVSTAGSILAWVNLAQLPSMAGRIFYVAGASAVADDFDLQIQTDNKIYFYTDSEGSVSSPMALSAADVGTWIFVAATFTASGDRNLYINGTLVNSNLPGSHYDSGSAFTIGYSNVFGGRAFNGDIAQVAFFNTDLSAGQIAAIDAAAFTAIPEPPSIALVGVGLLVFVAQDRRRSSRNDARLEL